MTKSKRCELKIYDDYRPIIKMEADSLEDIEKRIKGLKIKFR